MGPNGSGKTTYLKTILGEHDAYVGSFKLGASLKISYFAQGHEDLTLNRTVIEEVTRVSHLRDRDARDFLAKFLFRGDDVFKRVDALSGGERGRLSLAKLILQDANLLLLDEPTNHLDIPSQEVLEGALIDFPETIIMVSHDRYLIDRLATQLWVINPEGKFLTIYQGAYSEYVAAQRDNRGPQRIKARANRAKHSSKKRPASDVISLEEVEEKVTALEEELRKISEKLMEVGEDFTQVRELSERYAILERDLQHHLEVWERFASRNPGA
jgi:ATP-binding cassette subfamily F protein 3